MRRWKNARRTGLIGGCLVWLLAWATSMTTAQTRETWPDPVANHVAPYRTAGMTHGPMLGRPAATSMRVWVRTAEPTAFRVVYDTNLPLAESATGVEGQTSADDDNTGTADLERLRPNTRYYYGIVINGQLADTRMDFDQPWPSFRTLPDADSYRDQANNPRGLFNVVFSVGCCESQDPLTSGGQYPSPASFLRMLQLHGDDLMFHLMDGDYIYEELRDGQISGYRNNYKLYMDRGRSLSNFLRYVPNLFTFDDHEMDRETGGFNEVGLKAGAWLTRDEALEAWNEYAGWANYDSPYKAPLRFGTARLQKGSDVLLDPGADFSSLDLARATSVQVLRESKNAGVYGPVEVLDKNRLRVRPAFRADEVCRYTIGSHHFYDWKVSNCHFFALDCRSERARYSRNGKPLPDQRMLGQTQYDWLLRGVKESDADFVFLMSSVPWMMPHTAYHVSGSLDDKGDSFVSFLAERESLLEALDALDKPVCILTGDVHNSFSIQITDNVWEFMVGPLNSAAHPIGTAGKPAYGGWYDSAGRRVKIKWVAGFPDNVSYMRLHSTYYGVVQVNNAFKSARPEGPGYQWVAYDSPQVVVAFHDGYSGKLVYAEGISMVDVR